MQNTLPKVWITGMGTVNCAGQSPQELWEKALKGVSTIQGGFGAVPADVLASLQDHEAFLNRAASPFLILTLHAMRQAMQSAGWEGLNAKDAVFFATTTGQVIAWENDLMDFLEGKISPDRLAQTLQHEPLAGGLNQALQILGAQACHRQVISSACSASTQALVLASWWLKQGRGRRCLVGGTELLCQLTKAGFGGLKLLSTNPALPFDRDRGGINLSEASAFLCLETEPATTPLAILSGGGLTSDGYHMTSPQPQGEGIRRAMELALRSAGLTPGQIDWIHAHGTGSQANDAAEAQAIGALFSGFGPLVSSTKPVHGHALAVSGVLESILSIKGIQEEIALPTLGLRNPDWIGSLRFPQEPERGPIKHVLKNSLGFGGANAAVVFSSLNA